MPEMLHPQHSRCRVEDMDIDIDMRCLDSKDRYRCEMSRLYHHQDRYRHEMSRLYHQAPTSVCRQVHTISSAVPTLA